MSPAAWRTRHGECSGVVETGRRAGLFGGEGDAGKGEPGGVAHSIAWGVGLKMFRAGFVRRRAISPGRGGYELAAVRMRADVGGRLGLARTKAQTRALQKVE